ncbi:Bmp protein, partial [Pseudomonas syringae pv. maculicola]
SYGPAVTAAAKQQADAIKAQMLAGQFVIFKGPLKDNKGAVVIADGVAQTQTDIALESMNYLVEGVLGQI